MNPTKLLLLLLMINVLTAAAVGDEKFNAKKTLKEADRAMKEGNLYVANDLYKKIMDNEAGNAEIAMKLAGTYQTARDYELAEKYFNQAYLLDSTYQIALFQRALMLKMMGSYKEAISVFQKFSKLYKTAEDAPKYKKWTKTEIDGCNYALREMKPDGNIQMEQLGKEVNSNYTDVSPSLNNGYLYFSSIRSDTVIVIHPDSSFDPALMKMYKSPLFKSGDAATYGPAQHFDQYKLDGRHTTNGAFSSDGKKFFYTICNGSQTNNNCAIWVSEWNGSEWDNGKELGQEVNFDTYSTTHPYYAKMKNGQEVLFFASNRPGGKGGNDIYYSLLDKKGGYGAPKNAGAKVNTDRDEVTSFYDVNTNTLYFSSNGLINMGGYDIFKSKGEPGKFENVENMGAPFNSSCEDLYYRMGETEKQGCIVSNRPGIFSVKGKTCCHDIFSFKYRKLIEIAVMGNVYVEGDATHTPVAGVPVYLSLKSDENSESDVVINYDTTTTRDYFFSLKADKSYKLSCNKEGYFTNSQAFNTRGIQNSDTLHVDLYIKKYEKNKEYRLNNIYYDFDKWDLREESKLTLDTLYNILQENPTIIIELGSHTDVRGTDSYNQTLSQKRAESCVNYLLGRGIPKERISAKGYGETQLLNDCSKVEGCPMDQSGDCPCHQLNRRTVFKIVGELDGKLIYDNE